VSGNDYIQILAGSWDIAHNKYSARDWEEERANARLIAAAPDLLTAAKMALGTIELDALNEPEAKPIATALRDAIAQAERRQP
jgi:hypothetical protein